MSKFEPILRVKDLSTHFFTYAGEIKALDAINLKIEREKESLGLVGETGCGKSVTALSIMQLIPQPPGKIIQGEIWFNGENLLAKSARYMQREIRGKNISMIFQEPMTSLNPVIRIADQIMEAIQLHPETNKNGDGEVRDRAIELLDLTGIPDPEEVATRYPHQLSGGMRQRVMISMALACNPKLLIADEPTTALDVTIQAQILGLINKIRDEFGISLLLITHHLGLISAMCDKVAVMYAGTIVEYSDLKSIFNNPLHPYTQGLLKCIPRLGGKRGRKLSTIPGNVPDLINPPSGCRFHPRCDKGKTECVTTKPTLIKMEKNHYVACHQ